MARQFAPKHFLRIAPNRLLGEYFHERGLLESVDFDQRDESDIDDVFDAWQALPPSERAAVDADFIAVDSLATKEAVATLIREAAFLGIDIAASLPEDGGHHDKSLAVFLHQLDLFDRVHQLVDAEVRPIKYWVRRNDLPEVRVMDDEDTLGRLASTLRYFFREAEGRGRVCEIEAVRRQDAAFYFCYLEDWGRVERSFGADDRLERSARRPAFEVIFAVSPVTSSLETYFEGPRRTVDQIEKLFARTVFGYDLPERRDGTVYELNVLKDRRFAFHYDPPAGITTVLIKHLRFAPIGGRKRKLLLEADPGASRQDIYDFMDDVFDTVQIGGEKLPLAAHNITQARIQVLFEPIPRRRQPSRTFNVSYPNSCSLSHEGQDAAIREMLRRSGIEKLPPPEPQGHLDESRQRG